MKLILRTLAAAAMMILFVACSGVPKIPPFPGTPPKTIAVLPFDGDLTLRGRTAVRRLLGSFLTDRNYIKLDDEVVDEKLAQAGFQPWTRGWQPSDEQLAAFGRSVGAGALVLGTGLSDSSVSAAILYKRGVYGTFRWFDVGSAKTVWTVETGSSKTGGIALESGQALKALSQTISSAGEEAFMRLAAKMTFDLAEAVPPHPTAHEIQARPVITSMTMDSPRRNVHAGDIIRIRVDGTPGGRGRASVAGLGGGVPLVETSRGIYEAAVRIEAGLGSAEGYVTATLYDATGQASDPARPQNNIIVEAPRMDPPEGLVAQIVDPATRRVRLTWKSAFGAAHYAVARIGSGPPVTLDASGALEFVDTLPQGQTSATYAVSAACSAGVFGPPSPAVTAVLE